MLLYIIMVYNYTKPRGKIAAMYSSPGPIYMLPGLVGQNKHDSRSVHYKAPAWPFGIRHGKYTNDSSPGPAYLPDAKIFRDGKDGAPHYSLYSRPKNTSLLSTPGAGAYCPENSTDWVHPRAPGYSFGLRHHTRRTDNIPAANAYQIDPMLGRTYRSEKRSAPVISITGRSKVGSFHEDLRKTPGPGTYSVTQPSVYKERPASYSLTSRNPMPGDTSQIPGPGAHPAENVRANRKSAPAFSFGIRHSQYKGEFISAADMQD